MDSKRDDFLKNPQGLSIRFASDAPAQWKQAIEVSVYLSHSKVPRKVGAVGTAMTLRNAHNFNRSLFNADACVGELLKRFQILWQIDVEAQFRKGKFFGGW